MKIAIHDRLGSFSDRWIEYCKLNDINYKLVNCYDSNIIFQLRDCDAIMWHFHHAILKDNLFARQLLYSLENVGIKTYPNFFTSWHFDDKIAQKYLLESIDAPIVNTYIFYDKKEAMDWLNDRVSFPLVFKLSPGSSSENVRLINSRKQAFKLLDTAFRNGFPSRSPSFRMVENWRRFKLERSTHFLKETISGVKNMLFPSVQERLNTTTQKGYVYFQDFISNLKYDTRVVVVNQKAFAFRRFVRDNDFRSSGSGKCKYDKSFIDERCIAIAFDVSKKIRSQSLAFDFVIDQNNNPLILELSYAFMKGSDSCQGFWDDRLNWHEGPINPQYWMVEDLISSLVY